MKKTSHLILLVFIFCSPFLFSQTIQYGGMQQLGLVFGEGKTNTSFHLINGIRYKRFFMGIGADAEFARKEYYFYGYYSPPSFNTSAVFADVRYYINKKKNFFVLTDLGVNFITEKFSSGEYAKYNKQAGYYASIGVGFKARIGKELFYSFDLNYCLKQTRYDYSYNYNYGYSSYMPPRQQTEKYDLRKNCLLLRMGLEIF